MLRHTTSTPSAQLESLMVANDVTPSQYFDSCQLFPITKHMIILYDIWNAPPVTCDALTETSSSVAERLVLLCASLGWKTDDLNELVTGPGLPIREAIRQCQLKAPDLWPRETYALMNRADQIAMITGSGLVKKREVSSM